MLIFPVQTTDAYCHNADPLHGALPCQAGYGACAITSPPSCAEDGGSSERRTVGYYQSWNIRKRLCNKVVPRQLNTTGYTHLFYSFATIDPVLFTIQEADPSDPDLMKEFTALKVDGKLQTWIAVGGFDFSDNNTATHYTVCFVQPLPHNLLEDQYSCSGHSGEAQG